MGDFRSWFFRAPEAEEFLWLIGALKNHQNWSDLCYVCGPMAFSCDGEMDVCRIWFCYQGVLKKWRYFCESLASVSASF